MRSEHRGEPRALDQSAIFGPAHRTVIWIGPQQPTRQLVQNSIVRHPIGAADVVRNTAGTVDKRRVAQVMNQLADVIAVEGADAYATADCQRYQQDRIAEGSSSARAVMRAVRSRSSWVRGPARTNGASGTRRLCR